MAVAATDDYLDGERCERARCLEIARKWSSADHIQLHAGEMKAQEMRSVKAVVNAIIRELET